MYRFHPQINKALELIHSGEIGNPILIRSAFTFVFNRGKDNYRWSPQMGGGALYDVGCYTINAARLIFQEEPDEVYARSHLDEQTGIDLTTSLLCSFSGGRQALLSSSFELQFQSGLEVSGELGRIFLTRAFSAKHFETEIQILKGDKKEIIKFPGTDQYQLMVEHLGDVISGGIRPLLDFKDSYGNARVIDTALKSARSGRAISS
jgi:predicted dehydrogenase